MAITDDSLSESDEQFFLDHLLVDPQGYNITLDPSSAQITIIDDDGKFVVVYLFVFISLCFNPTAITSAIVVVTRRRTIFHCTTSFMHQHYYHYALPN